MINSPVLLKAKPRTLKLFAKRLVAAGIRPEPDSFGKISKDTGVIIYFPHANDFGFYRNPSPDIFNDHRFRASKFDHALKTALTIKNLLTINKLNNA